MGWFLLGMVFVGGFLFLLNHASTRKSPTSDVHAEETQQEYQVITAGNRGSTDSKSRNDKYRGGVISALYDKLKLQTDEHYRQKCFDECGLIVLDTETTGLSNSDRVVTLAAIHFLGGVEKERLHLVFSPGRNSHPRAAMVHGWRDADLKIQPTLNSHINEISDFLSKSQLWMGHNINFDVKFLKREHEAIEGIIANTVLLDTMLTAQQKISDIDNYKLDTCLEYFNFHRESKMHNALEDVMLTARLGFKLLSIECSMNEMGDGLPTNVILPLPFILGGSSIDPIEEKLLTAFPGIGLGTVKNLIENGYSEVEAIVSAGDEDLLSIRDFGPSKLKAVRRHRH